MRSWLKIVFLMLFLGSAWVRSSFAQDNKLFPDRKITPEVKRFVDRETSRLLKKYDVSNFEKIYDSDLRDVGDGILELSILAWVDPDPENLKLLFSWCEKAITISSWGNNTDLDIAHLLFGLSVAYDWHKDKMTPELSLKVKGFIYSHGKTIYTFARFAPGWWVNSYWMNHCWINYTGILAAGLALEGEYSDVAEWQKLAKDKLKKSLELQPPFGSSHEGFNYSVYGNVGFIRGLSLIEQNEPDIFQKSGYLKNYYKFYKAYAVSEKMDLFFDIGDSKRILGLNPVEIFAKLYQEYGTEEYARLASYYLLRYKGKYQSRFPGLMTAVYGIPPENSTAVKFSKNDLFEDLGIYIEKTFNKDEVDTSFLFKSGIPGGRWAHEMQQKDKTLRLNRSHSHPDQNHFIIWRKEGFLVADCAYTGKKKSTLEHNTLLVNGQGQLGEGKKWFNEKEINDKVFSSKAGLTEDNIVRGDEVSIVSADAAEFYPQDLGIEHFKRIVVWVKPIGFVIFDRIAMKKDAEGSFVFHSDFDFDLIKDQEYWISDGPAHVGKWMMLYPAASVIPSVAKDLKNSKEDSSPLAQNDAHGVNIEITKHTHIHKHDKFPKGQMMQVNKSLTQGNNYFITLILSEDINAQSHLVEDKDKIGVILKSKDREYSLFLDKESSAVSVSDNKLNKVLGALPKE